MLHAGLTAIAVGVDNTGASDVPFDLNGRRLLASVLNKSAWLVSLRSHHSTIARHLDRTLYIAESIHTPVDGHLLDQVVGVRHGEGRGS